MWIGLPARQLRLPPAAQRPRLRVTIRRELDARAEEGIRRRAALPLSPRTLNRTSIVPAVGYSQKGINQSHAYGQWNPADVTLGVGPDYLGEAVNAAVGWWRIGAVFDARRVRPLGAFFTTSTADRRTDQINDPRLLYDAASGRWFFVVFDVSRHESDLAVSASADPTQSWWIYTVPATGCPDQPRIAVSDTVLALSYDLFASCTGSGPPYGGVVSLFDKAALLSGAAPAADLYGPDSRFVSITPASSFDGGSTIYMVSTDYVDSQVILYTASGVGESSIPVQRVSVNLLRTAPPPAQLGSTVPLDSGDSRVQDAFLAGGNIWLAADDACTGSSFLLRDCIRYVELSESGQLLDQREEALANGRSALYPAIRPDGSGNIFSVFGYVSSTDYAGLAATIDPGHATGYAQLRVGHGANESERWGDYSSAARDPSDPSRVWVAGAYALRGGWGTYIAALATSPFSIPDPTGGPSPTPKDVTPPHVNAIRSSGRVGALVHLRYRLSDDSHQARERIRVRHGTRTIATLRTALSLISNGRVYYAVWRAPQTAPANLSFCVTASDPSGNASSPSCAPLHLAGGR